MKTHQTMSRRGAGSAATAAAVAITLNSRSLSIHARRLSVAMAAVAAFAGTPGVHSAVGAPSDITESAAPMAGAEAPKATAINAGDASVSTATGALSFGFPLTVPPGRQGAQPQLALSYSSQGAIYGGLAAG